MALELFISKLQNEYKVAARSGVAAEKLTPRQLAGKFLLEAFDAAEALANAEKYLPSLFPEIDEAKALLSRVIERSSTASRTAPAGEPQVAGPGPATSTTAARRA